MSDVKAKKIDVRLPQEVYEQVTVVAWGIHANKSELLRLMIDHFIQTGTLEVAGQKLTWGECLQHSESRCESENLSVDDLHKPRSAKESVALPVALDDKLKRHVDAFIQNTIQVVKEEIGE